MTVLKALPMMVLISKVLILNLISEKPVHLVHLVPKVHILEVPIPVMIGLVTDVTVLKPVAMVLLVWEVPVLKVRVLEVL